MPKLLFKREQLREQLNCLNVNASVMQTKCIDEGVTQEVHSEGLRCVRGRARGGGGKVERRVG